MKKRRTLFSAGMLLLLAATATLVIVEELGPETKDFRTPRLNNDRKWQIAYVQSGEDQRNLLILKAMTDGLARLGWMKPVDWSGLDKNADFRQRWHYLSDHADSAYLTFVKNACWSSGWQTAQRARDRKAILARLQNAKDINLCIAMDAWSSDDLAGNAQQTPVLAIASASRPAGAGLSGVRRFPHVFINRSPELLVRQIRMFHHLTGFKKLGVAYDPAVNSLEELQSVAREKQFKLVAKAVAYSAAQPEEAGSMLARAHAELAKEADAVWVMAITDEIHRQLPKILDAVHKNKIPTWSPRGERFVEAGALFGVRTFPQENAAEYAEAFTIALGNASASGTAPELNERYELIINHATAKLIDYKIPRGLLFAADNNYLSIKAADKK